ncbi:MAG: lysylphosphatidylglycerol synthase domain-containing protein, partial [Patescibacteria group bacterium]
MTTSIMSNVPGGIGIFETAIIFLLPKSLSASDILGSLLAYRGIRFLLPLITAMIFVCYFEIKRRLTKN